MSNESCPICGGVNLVKIFKHQKWKGYCFRCIDCTHICYLDYNNKIDPSDFGTNTSRSDYYLNILKDIHYNSILDIGAPEDLYFLKQIHDSNPLIKTIGFDIFKHNHPPYIEMTNTLDNMSVDIAIALHVLEHVPLPLPFLKKIIEISKKFIIEIPDETEEWRAERSTRNPHYHCFTHKSFSFLLNLCGVPYNISRRLHKKIYPALCANNL